MGKILVKRFGEPDEVVSVPGNVSNVVTLGDTSSCQIHYQRVVLSGQMQISSEDGIQRTIGPREAFDIQPGHDGWVVGDEPCIFIEFHGVRE